MAHIFPLEGSLRSRALGSLLIGPTSFNRQHYRRDRRIIVEGGLDQYFIQLFVSGAIKGDCEGVSFSGGPGDICVFDLARPFSSQVEPGSTISVILPPQRVERATRGRSVRGPGELAFSPSERAILASMEPFLAHAMATGPDLDIPLSDSGQSGLLVADRRGRCVFASSEGRRLLFLAQNPKMSPDSRMQMSSHLPVELVAIYRRLDALFAGRPVESPPVFHHRNVWGGFCFRAHWLDDGEGNGLIGISVTHQEPTSARMARTLSRLPLTSRQSEIGLLLATGVSNADAADRLGISRHTVVSHERWIYDKLNVRSRLELARYLLAN